MMKCELWTGLWTAEFQSWNRRRMRQWGGNCGEAWQISLATELRTSPGKLVCSQLPISENGVEVHVKFSTSLKCELFVIHITSQVIGSRHGVSDKSLVISTPSDIGHRTLQNPGNKLCRGVERWTMFNSLFKSSVVQWTTKLSRDAEKVTSCLA